MLAKLVDSIRSQTFEFTTWEETMLRTCIKLPGNKQYPEYPYQGSTSPRQGCPPRRPESATAGKRRRMGTRLLRVLYYLASSYIAFLCLLGEGHRCERGGRQRRFLLPGTNSTQLQAFFKQEFTNFTLKSPPRLRCHFCTWLIYKKNIDDETVPFSRHRTYGSSLLQDRWWCRRDGTSQVYPGCYHPRQRTCTSCLGSRWFRESIGRWCTRKCPSRRDLMNKTIKICSMFLPVFCCNLCTVNTSGEANESLKFIKLHRCLYIFCQHLWTTIVYYHLQ